METAVDRRWKAVRSSSALWRVQLQPVWFRLCRVRSADKEHALIKTDKNLSPPFKKRFLNK